MADPAVSPGSDGLEDVVGGCLEPAGGSAKLKRNGGLFPLWKETSLVQKILSNALFRILVEWVTISTWPFSVSRHHLLYSSIPQEVPQHYPLGMVQHFMNPTTKEQFFCFVSSKWGSERSYHFWFWELVLPTLNTACNTFIIQRQAAPFRGDECYQWSAGLKPKPNDLLLLGSQAWARLPFERKWTGPDGTEWDWMVTVLGLKILLLITAREC